MRRVRFNPEQIIDFDPEKNDVWALGVVIFRLFAKLSPFLADKSVGSHHNLESFWDGFEAKLSSPLFPELNSPRFRDVIFRSGEDYGNFKQFLTRMWSRDLNERPTFSEMRAACTDTDIDTVQERPPESVCRAAVYDDLRWLRGDRLEGKQFLEQLVARNSRIKVYSFSPQIWFNARVVDDLFDDFENFARTVCSDTVDVRPLGHDALPTLRAADLTISIENGTQLQTHHSDFFFIICCFHTIFNVSQIIMCIDSS